MKLVSFFFGVVNRFPVFGSRDVLLQKRTKQENTFMILVLICRAFTTCLLHSLNSLLHLNRRIFSILFYIINLSSIQETQASILLFQHHVFVLSVLDLADSTFKKMVWYYVGQEIKFCFLYVDFALTESMLRCIIWLKILFIQVINVVTSKYQ